MIVGKEDDGGVIAAILGVLHACYLDRAPRHVIVGHGAGDAGDSCSAQAAGATGSGSVTAAGSSTQQSSSATAAGYLTRSLL